MHTFSCFFLLHHHFEALTTSTDCISISSSSINDNIMSDEYESEDEQTSVDLFMQIPSDEIIVTETDNLPVESTINPVDEDSQFIFDEDTNRLLCIGTHFSDIPLSILDAYASKTMVRIRYFGNKYFLVCFGLFRFLI